jgi:predicted transposase/invertase (TIGR01784 family)
LERQHSVEQNTEKEYKRSNKASLLIMRRDSIFYKLFRQFPTLLFDLLDNPPPNATTYRFDSVAVKEPKFEIDGVFLPSKLPGVVYFCEVQFQKDEQLYERLFSESFLYFYRNRRDFTTWHFVILYPSRTTEQTDSLPYYPLLDSPLVDRIYLDELGSIEQLPITIALMVLTTLQNNEAPEKARALLARAPQEVSTPTQQQAIIEMVATIMVYKFTTLSRSEIDAMLGLTLQETRVYQEAKAEGEQIGETRGLQQGMQQGQQQGQRSLLLLLLNQKFNPLPKSLADGVAILSLEQLETLAIQLLSFENVSDLRLWLTIAVGDRLLQGLAEQLGESTDALRQPFRTAMLDCLLDLNQQITAGVSDGNADLISVEAIAAWLQERTD